MTTEFRKCRSSFEGEPCILPRHEKDKHLSKDGKQWTGGVRSEGFPIIVDSGYYSEADYQTWKRW